MVWPLPKSNDKISLVFLPKDNFYYIMRPTQSVSEALYYASDTVWDLEKFSNSETMTLSSQPLGLVIFSYQPLGLVIFFEMSSYASDTLRVGSITLCARHKSRHLEKISGLKIRTYEKRPPKKDEETEFSKLLRRS